MPVGDKPVDLPDMPCGACDAGLAECVGDDAQSNRLMLRLQYADAEPHRAENETRTRDPNLGKVMLYQLSYFRNVVPRTGLEPSRGNPH